MASSKAASGRSSIFKNESGWHGFVSLGTDPLTGRRRRRHLRGATRSEVVRAVQKVEAQREAGDLDLAGGPVTVEVWLRHWLTGVHVSKRAATYAKAEWAVRVHLIPALGHLRLDKLTPELIGRGLDGLSRPGRDGVPRPSTLSTRREVLHALSTALSVAVEQRRITRNPARLVKLAPHEAEEIQPLTKDEISAVLRACAERRNGLRWVLALALGLRQSETLGLRWTDVDLDGQTVTVRYQLARQTWQHGCADAGGCGPAGKCPQRKSRPRLAPLKTRGARRTLHLDHQLVESLRAHKRSQAKERLRAANLWKDGDWVFSTQVGTPIEHRNDLRDWRSVLAEANVDHARIHDLRHTHATLLLMGGVPTRVVQDLLGWSSPAMAGRYQHVVPELSQQAARMVGAQLFGAAAQPAEQRDQGAAVDEAGPRSSSA